MILYWLILHRLGNTYNPNFSLQNENVISNPRLFPIDGSLSMVASPASHVLQICMDASLTSYVWLHHYKFMDWFHAWSNYLVIRSVCWCMIASLVCIHMHGASLMDHELVPCMVLSLGTPFIGHYADAWWHSWHAIDMRGASLMDHVLVPCMVPSLALHL